MRPSFPWVVALSAANPVPTSPENALTSLRRRSARSAGARRRRLRLRRRLRRWGGDRLFDRGGLSAFAVGQPHVINRMLNPVQSGACREHPPPEQPFHLALQGDLVDLDKSVGVGRFGRWARVTGAWPYPKRAKLHGLVDRDLEFRDPASDLVEPGKHRGRVRNLLRRRLGHDLFDRRTCRCRRRLRSNPGRGWQRARVRWKRRGLRR